MNVPVSQPSVPAVRPGCPTPRCWLHRSLPGEYLALAVTIHAIGGAVAWGVAAWRAPAALSLVLAAAWLVARASGACSARWFAPLVTGGLALGVVLCWKTDAALPDAAPAWLSPAAFLSMLVVILAADVSELVPLLRASRAAARLRRLNWHRLAVWACAGAFVVYMILLPTAAWIGDYLQPPSSGRILADMSLAEQVRLRSMEAMTALWFLAVGGTIGSFLNVVAYRLPRGESVVLRRSRCPACAAPIQGRDNVPILGWLMLGGRCRACQAPISLRYPLVEAIAAALFLWLYFVELISGGANLPVREPNAYRGVVWIVFYTKWDLVGLYSYHCVLLCVLLTCVLLDVDRQRAPARTKWCVAAALLLPPLLWPELLPVPLFAQAAERIPAAALRAGLGCLAGGLTGAALGWATARACAPPAPGSASAGGHFVGGLAVVGIALGWQATVAVALLALLLRLVALAIPVWRRSSPPPTVFLLTALVVHHTLWRWAVVHLAPWWPSHQTSAAGWTAVAAAFAALLVVNRRGGRSGDVTAAAADQAADPPGDAPP